MQSNIHRTTYRVLNMLIPRRYAFGPLALLLVCTSIFVGCGGASDGPERVHVQGTVMFDGQPVPKGRIIFEPDASAGNSGPQGFANIEQGKYDTDTGGRGPIAGAQVVQITGFDGIAIEASAEEEESPSGSPLFPTWKTTFEVPSESSVEKNFEIPREN